MYASKDAGGNPKSTAAHDKVDEAATLMNQAVSELTATLEKAGGEAGLISGKEWNVSSACVLTAFLIHRHDRGDQQGHDSSRLHT